MRSAKCLYWRVSVGARRVEKNLSGSLRKLRSRCMRAPWGDEALVVAGANASKVHFAPWGLLAGSASDETMMSGPLPPGSQFPVPPVSPGFPVLLLP